MSAGLLLMLGYAAGFLVAITVVLFVEAAKKINKKIISKQNRR